MGAVAPLSRGIPRRSGLLFRGSEATGSGCGGAGDSPVLGRQSAGRERNRASVSKRTAGSMGLARWAFIPASRELRMSSS